MNIYCIESYSENIPYPTWHKQKQNPDIIIVPWLEAQALKKALQLKEKENLEKLLIFAFDAENKAPPTATTEKLDINWSEISGFLVGSNWRNHEAILKTHWQRLQDEFLEQQTLLQLQENCALLRIQIEKVDKELKFEKNQIKNLKEKFDQLNHSLRLHEDYKNQQSHIAELSEQWENTFQSVDSPICLVDSRFRAIRANKSFLELAVNRRFTPEKNIFENFLGFDIELEPQKPLRALQKTTNSKAQKKEFEILWHAGDYHVVVFRDVTNEAQMERDLLRASKASELGIITSSIAHELNNPLAGMLSLVQLMKMTISKESPVFEDLAAMEEAIIRCKEIVIQLLSHVRTPPQV